MAQRERIDIQTGTETRSSTGISHSWSSDIRWCNVIYLTADQAVQRYQCELDKKIRMELWFKGNPTVTMKNTRFVWKTDGSPNENRIYKPQSATTNTDGTGRYVVIMVEEEDEERP